MIFFGKKNNAPTAPDAKRRITVGRLFNPEIGTSLRPFGEVGKVLVDLIALIFTTHGLIPRNHPAIVGVSGARLTLGEVIGTAWHNLTFTRNDVPRVLIFFAVIMSLVCSALAIIVAILAALTGTAHAQSFPTGAGMFAPVDTTNDIACGWINWLFNATFNGCQIQDYLSAATNGEQSINNLLSTNVQTALIAALGFYSDAILVVAAVVLFYHLTSMVVETAHHGVAMGRRANQVWAPIRLVVAVGLLVPISNGLNSGQFIVVQIAQWGSGLASETWNSFLSALVKDAGTLPQNGAPYVRQVVTDIVLSEACTYAYNKLQGEITNNGGGGSMGQIPSPAAPDGAASADGSQKYSYQPPNPGPADADLCGFYIMPGTPTVSTPGNSTNNIEQQTAQTAQQSANQAFNSMQTQAQQYAIQGMNNYLPQSDGGTSGDDITQNITFEQVVTTYQQGLQGAMQAATSGLQSIMQQIQQTSSQQGWVSAGAWFNTIARVVGTISTIMRDLLPQTSPPKVTTAAWTYNCTQHGKCDGSLRVKVMQAMKWFADWMQDEERQNGGTPTTGTGQTGIAAQQQQMQLAMADQMSKGGTQTHVMDVIFWLVDWIASWDGVWKPAGSFATATNPAKFSLGVQFLSANPLAEIAELGHANIDAAYDTFDAYLLLEAAAGTGGMTQAVLSSLGRTFMIGPLLNLLGALTGAAGSAIGAIGAILGAVTVVFFTAGFMLAYFFPLIPFIRFLFATLAWFLSLLESIVAMPLVALAHLTPEGEGLPGEKAKAAYYMIFNLFLKPVLMVFGLIMGLLLFNLAASAMNLLYLVAVVGTGGISHGHVTLARLVYSILYVVILYMFCNNAFKMIDWLPEHCIKWMGAQGLHIPQMHDPTEIGAYMAFAASMVDRQIVEGAGKLARATGPAGIAALANHMPAVASTMATSTAKLVPGSASTQAAVAGGINKVLTQAGGVEREAERIGGQAGAAMLNKLTPTTPKE